MRLGGVLEKFRPKKSGENLLPTSAQLWVWLLLHMDMAVDACSVLYVSPSCAVQDEDYVDGHDDDGKPASDKPVSSKYRGVCWNRKVRILVEFHGWAMAFSGYPATGGPGAAQKLHTQPRRGKRPETQSVSACIPDSACMYGWPSDGGGNGSGLLWCVQLQQNYELPRVNRLQLCRSPLWLVCALGYIHLQQHTEISSVLPTSS